MPLECVGQRTFAGGLVLVRCQDDNSNDLRDYEPDDLLEIIAAQGDAAVYLHGRLAAFEGKKPTAALLNLPGF